MIWINKEKLFHERKCITACSALICYCKVFSFLFWFSHQHKNNNYSVKYNLMNDPSLVKISKTSMRASVMCVCDLREESGLNELFVFLSLSRESGATAWRTPCAEEAMRSWNETLITEYSAQTMLHWSDFILYLQKFYWRQTNDLTLHELIRSW